MTYNEILKKGNFNCRRKEIIVDIGQLHVLEGYNHFEIIVALGNPYNLPGELMITQMGLK